MPEQPTPITPIAASPCSVPDSCEDGELCDRHETERAHAEGEHTFCGLTCEAEFPTEMLRNAIIAGGIPGTAGMLDELVRRAAAPTADSTAVLRARDEGAIEALRTAAEHVDLGAAVGPIPLEARPAVSAWLCRLAEQRLDRARKRAAEALHAALATPGKEAGR